MTEMDAIQKFEPESGLSIIAIFTDYPKCAPWARCFYPPGKSSGKRFAIKWFHSIRKRTRYSKQLVSRRPREARIGDIDNRAELLK